MTAIKRASILLILSVALNCLSAYSQGLDGKLMPRQSRSLNEGSVQVKFKGMTVEVIAEKSVNERILASGEVVHEVVARPEEAVKLSVKNPVLIFNHGLGEYGFVTGEIAIKFRRSQDVGSFPVSEFLEFSKVGNLDFYTVQASSPEQFATYMGALLARKDLLWVEPTVRYVSDIKSDKVRY